MIRPEETTGTASETHDASRSPAPRLHPHLRRGHIHPSVRVPMREITLSDTKSFNGRIEKNEPVRVYDCSGPWGDPAFTGTVRRRPARPAPRLDPRPRRCRSLRRPPRPAAGQRLPHRKTRRIRLAIREAPTSSSNSPASPPSAASPLRARPANPSPSSTTPARASSRPRWSSSPSAKTCAAPRSRIMTGRHRPQRSRQTARRLRSAIRRTATLTLPRHLSSASRSASPPRSRRSSSAAKSPPAAPSSRSTSTTRNANR